MDQDSAYKRSYPYDSPGSSRNASRSNTSSYRSEAQNTEPGATAGYGRAPPLKLQSQGSQAAYKRTTGQRFSNFGFGGPNSASGDGQGQHDSMAHLMSTPSVAMGPQGSALGEFMRPPQASALPQLKKSYSDPDAANYNVQRQFHNPWSQRSQGSAISSSSSGSISTSSGSTSSGSSSLPQQNVSNVRQPPHQGLKPSFASSLSTTFEDMELGIIPNQRRNPSIVPPPRSDAPLPSVLTSPARKPVRRQSVATTPQRNRQAVALPMSASYTDIAPSFAQVRSASDIHPVINDRPKYRRSDTETTVVSPLRALTSSLTVTYKMCVPDFDYRTSKNPRRVLTKPSQPRTNHGFDNDQNDYILYVNDILGVQENKKYMVVDILGRGTFGQVVKCQDLDTQELVAVKVVKSRSVYLNQSLTEAAILEYISTQVDPNDEFHLLRMKDKFMHRGHLCLVLELLSSNLYELIQQNQFHGLALKLIRKFAIQLVESLCKLKEADLIHCDLKPENILLESLDRPDIKVIDFGSARHEKQAPYSYVQSRFYRSPEVALGLSYSAAVDMWSLGCILAELFLGIPLFPATSEYDLLRRFIRMLGMPPTWMIEMGKNSVKFMNRSIDPNTGKHLYSLKPWEQFSHEFHVKEQLSKEYFKDRYLEDIIMNYRLPRKNMTRQMVEKEMEGRRCLAHFLRGILNFNLLERWTPQEASMHPFLTGETFTESWTPSSR